jgi:deferrochelatase/peroxidase EfeB
VQGHDRFGIAGLKPACLKVIPRVDGDEGFLPRDVVTDLIIMVASDDVYVNEYIFGRLYYGGVHRGIAVRRVERGYVNGGDKMCQMAARYCTSRVERKGL